MKRLVLFLLMAAGLAASARAETGQSFNGMGASGDPIAAAITESAQAATPALAEAPGFSPQAISDLLKQESDKPGSAALPRAVDVAPTASRNTPDAAMATARAPLTAEAINGVRLMGGSTKSRKASTRSC